MGGSLGYKPLGLSVIGIRETIPAFQEPDKVCKFISALLEADEIRKTLSALREADEIPKTLSALREADEIPKTLSALREADEIRKTLSALFHSNSEKRKLWPNVTIGIPLLIEDEIKQSKTLHNNVLSAINEFHSKTVIKFRQISQDDVKKFPEHIVISYSTDITASTNVGMSVFGGPHRIWLQNWVHPGGVMHELMHILGFVHEHQRPDRDLFVEVNSKQADDIIYEECYCIGKYDPESVMHYIWDEFIKPKKGGLLTDEQIQKLHNFPKSLSKGDIHAINFLYGGERKCTFDEDQRDYVSQAFYECKTCWGEDSRAGCCVSCRFSCHDKHEVVSST